MNRRMTRSRDWKLNRADCLCWGLLCQKKKSEIGGLLTIIPTTEGQIDYSATNRAAGRICAWEGESCSRVTVSTAGIDYIIPFP